jgi:hypothetical protein
LFAQWIGENVLKIITSVPRFLGSVFQIAVTPTLMSTTPEAIERFAPLERGCYVEGKDLFKGCLPVLPDFSWSKNTKRGKIYQMTANYIKLP